nr:hypothetical protein [Pseudomonas sp. 2FG]
MTAGKTVNGYLISQASDGNWWVCTANAEQIAGPFTTEKQAAEVAEVLQDQPPPPRRRSDPRA